VSYIHYKQIIAISVLTVIQSMSKIGLFIKVKNIISSSIKKKESTIKFIKLYLLGLKLVKKKLKNVGIA